MAVKTLKWRKPTNYECTYQFDKKTQEILHRKSRIIDFAVESKVSQNPSWNPNRKLRKKNIFIKISFRIKKKQSMTISNGY